MTALKWLNAYSDQEINLSTLPSCLTLCDLKRDNYYKLIALDIPIDMKSRCKLKVFKGTGLVSEQGLPGIPSAVKSFYLDEPEPKIPIIAVAIGPSVLFYRNMKPYYKYTVPGMSIEPLEMDIWRKLPVEKTENQQILIDNLKSMEFSSLTWISQKLITLPIEECDDFIKIHSDSPLQRLSVITTMATLSRTSSDLNPPSCLIICTENGEILIIDTQGFLVIYHAKVCSFDATPSLISASGQFDTDFRIVISSREGSIFLLRKSWLEGREIAHLEEPAIGLILLPVDQTIVVAGMTNSLICYSKKGKILWSNELEISPICMTPVHLPHLGLTLVAIALQGGLIRLYHHKMIVDEFQLDVSVQAMIFGHLGQEEHCLCLILDNGTLLVKILKRTANFNITNTDTTSNQVKSWPPTATSMIQTKQTLIIPKKSSIFIEQAAREKQNAKSIYNCFQAELWRLRLTAARTTVETIKGSENTMSIGGDFRNAPIKLAAEICGAGPQFRLFLTIENMSANQEATNLSVLLHADQKHYTLPKAFVKIPTIIPGAPLRVDFEIVAVLDPIDGLPPVDLTIDTSIIRVMIIKFGQTKPLIAAVVSMPVSEAPLE